MSGEPKLALEGKRWVVDFQKNQDDLKISETETNQSVYLYKCNNSMLTVSGKVNSIVLDNCVKTGVIFDNVISSVEFINCKRSKVQCNKSMPSMTIDKCDGVTVFLADKEAMNVEIVSSQSAEINVVTPPETEDGDSQEHPIPQQYMSRFKDGKLITEPVAHVGV